MRQLYLALATATAMLAMISQAERVHGQVRRYQPARPTVTPYLNLLRTNTSGLPNYYSLVRPQLNQLEFNQQQRALEATQARTLSQLRTDVQQALTPTGKGAGFMTVDRSGRFLNSAPYFPPPPAIQRR